MVAMRRATSVLVASSRLAMTWAAESGGRWDRTRAMSLRVLVADEAGDLLGVDAVQEGQRVRVAGRHEPVEDLLGLGAAEPLPQQLPGHVDTTLADLDGGRGVGVELRQDTAHVVGAERRAASPWST